MEERCRPNQEQPGVRCVQVRSASLRRLRAHSCRCTPHPDTPLRQTHPPPPPPPRLLNSSSPPHAQALLPWRGSRPSSPSPSGSSSPCFWSQGSRGGSVGSCDHLGAVAQLRVTSHGVSGKRPHRAFRRGWSVSGDSTAGPGWGVSRQGTSLGVGWLTPMCDSPIRCHGAAVVWAHALAMGRLASTSAP